MILYGTLDLHDLDRKRLKILTKLILFIQVFLEKPNSKIIQ